MKAYLTVTKKSLMAIFLTTLFAIIVSGQFYAAEHPVVNGKTNAQRVAFIKSLALIPDEDNAEKKQITIPETFSAVYSNYNDLQKKSGYDLSAYKGANALVYTYPVGKISEENNDDYYVNLIVYKGRIIGGDICSRNFNGEMLPLGKGKWRNSE